MVNIFKNYMVSKDGKIYSLKRNRFMKTSLNKKGYEQIYIVVNNKKLTTFVHRLVAIAYIPNPESLPQVNHKDGNKLNNCIENLEWCNDKTNQIHAFRNKLKIRKKILMYDLNNNISKEFESITECAKFLNTKQYTVSRVASGIRKSLYGRYTFKYIS